MVEDVLCLFEPLDVIRVYRRQYKRSQMLGKVESGGGPIFKVV